MTRGLLAFGSEILLDENGDPIVVHEQVDVVDSLDLCLENGKLNMDLPLGLPFLASFPTATKHFKERRTLKKQEQTRANELCKYYCGTKNRSCPGRTP